MFLLVSVRHVGAHPGEHQHGVSIQISISLGKTFLRISRMRNIPLTWTLGLSTFTSFHFPDSGLYLLNGFDFYFDLFWMAWHWKYSQNFKKCVCTTNITLILWLTIIGCSANIVSNDYWCHFATLPPPQRKKPPPPKKKENKHKAGKAILGLQSLKHAVLIIKDLFSL